MTQKSHSFYYGIKFGQTYIIPLTTCSIEYIRTVTMPAILFHMVCLNPVFIDENFTLIWRQS
jgi:hypothetical protein